MNWQLDAEPEPTILVLPPDAASLDEANAAIEMWEFYSRKTLDPTQRLWVQCVMAERADGRWAAQTTGRAMARQNGKGDELEVPEFWGLVQRAEAILHTIHDAVLLATQTQQRMLALFEHKDLRPKKKKVWTGTGQQMIELRNGGVIWYRTRTGGGGRGVDDIDRLVIDEAQHATSEQLAAVTPILFANSNPQLNIAGTAGLEGKSEWWWSQRIRALSGDPGAFAYMEHAAERVRVEPDGAVVQEPLDPLDRKVWRAMNTAIGCGRKPDGMEFLEEQLQRLGVEAFAQEHLCVWAPPENAGGTGPIDMARWRLLNIGKESKRPAPVALSVTVSQDRQWAHLGLAGVRADGKRHLQIVRSFRGTAGVVEEAARVAKEQGAVVAVVPSSPAGSLLQELVDAGVTVEEVAGRELGQATGMLLDGYEQGTVAHAGQLELDMAVEHARLRQAGESKVWEHRGDVDSAPVWAVTLALFALVSVKPPEPKAGVVYGFGRR